MTAIPAPNWTDEVEFEYELFLVSPDINCTDTIARSAGKYTTKIIWVEWAKPDFVKTLIDSLIATGWSVEEFSSPSKPQEELDIFNTTITARKRTTP